jgi:hypothetical protein
LALLRRSPSSDKAEPSDAFVAKELDTKKSTFDPCLDNWARLLLECPYSNPHSLHTELVDVINEGIKALIASDVRIQGIDYIDKSGHS